MHDDASGPKDDALNPRLGQGSVLKGSVVRVRGPECIDGHGLDLGCREPRDCSGLAPAALGEDRRDIVAIADAALLGRARDEDRLRPFGSVMRYASRPVTFV